MIDYLEGITLRSPYRKTQHALLLQRLCGDAWESMKNCPVPQSILDHVRAAGIRSALAMTTDEESDVLSKFDNLSDCRAVSLRLQLEENRHSDVYVHVALGCEIGVPSRYVDHTGTMSVVRTGVPLGSHPIKMHVDVDLTITDFFRDREAARKGFEAEMGRIVAVSRGIGAPATWERMLDLIPITRAHFLSHRREAERLAA
jgi:hypothetical protein